MSDFRRRCPSMVLTMLTLPFLIGCGHGSVKPHRSGDRVPVVETVKPMRSLLPVRAELTATIEPLQKTDLCARVPGVVTQLAPDIDIGRRIKSGEVLFRLDVPDLEAQKSHREAQLALARRQLTLSEQTRAVAASELKEAQKQEKRFLAELAYRRIEVKRVTELVARGAHQPERKQEAERLLEAAEAAHQTAIAAIETRTAKLAAAEAEMDVARARIDAASAEVHNVQTLIGMASIVAPFDGVITRRFVHQGTTIKDAGTPLLTVMQTDTVRILLDVSERDVPFIDTLIARGRKGEGLADVVTLRVPALQHVTPRGEFRGAINRSATALDPATRTMRTEVRLDNTSGHLRPGMYGTATILLEERYDVLTLPSNAMLRRGGKAEVYIVEDAQPGPNGEWIGTVATREVELGFDDGHVVEITRGLIGEEIVLARGKGVFDEGDKVAAILQKSE